jgi:hypothetical protein
MTRIQADRRWAGLRPARPGLLASIARGGAIVVVSVGIGAGLGAVVGCASQQKKQAPVVRDLRIQGNQEISSRQIKKKILTAKTGWWPFATKQYFDSVSWEADLRRIVRLYEAHGYYQARIVQVAAVPQPKGVALEV